MTLAHPNDMSVWDEIACERGHHKHTTRTAMIDLRAGHGYRDLAAVPARLIPEPYRMEVYPPDVYPVDGGPYCPAHDAVSETIVSHRIWEPRETILALQVCQGHVGELMVDVGAQLGWFSLLAGACGLEVQALDADAANVDALEQSARTNGWQLRVHALRLRVGPNTPPYLSGTRIRFAKIDLEGAEADALAMLWPTIAGQTLDHLMMEVSPVFKPGTHYQDLVARIVACGYDAFLLPPKQHPPVSMEDPPAALVPLLDLSVIPSWHQEDVWFKRQGASW